MKLGIDVNRHKEIIVKSISALLLLLLKHFKLNHIYQVSVEKGSAIAKLVLKLVHPDRTPLLKDLSRKGFHEELQIAFP